MWVAVVALVVGLTGTWVMWNGSVRDDVVVAGMSSEDEHSPVEFAAPPAGTIDPRFLHFVAPANGDERQLAERLFIDGSGWARAKTLSGCLERNGLSDTESRWALAMSHWYAGHGSPAEAKLPALRALAEDDLDRPYQDVMSRKVSATLERCSETDMSKPSRWLRDVEDLQAEYAASVADVIAAVEAGPVWEGVQRCLTDNGAPANGERGAPNRHIEWYIGWIADEQSGGTSSGNDTEQSTSALSRDGGASPKSRIFAQCAAPFYAEVERALGQPRELFVAEHRNELLRLQADFASFA
jgi:hypothetical protein